MNTNCSYGTTLTALHHLKQMLTITSNTCGTYMQTKSRRWCSSASSRLITEGTYDFSVAFASYLCLLTSPKLHQHWIVLPPPHLSNATKI